MADAIVSVVLEQLTSPIFEEMREEVRLVTGVEKEIEKLTTNFQAIEAVLLDADQRQVKERAVRAWLDKLKDASYDIDDILDEWKFAITKLQMEGAHQNVLVPKKKVCSFFPSPIFCFKQVGFRRDIALRIKEVNQNLDFIAEERKKYEFVPNRSTDEPQRSKTTSFVDVSEIRGRDEEKNDLVSKLLSDGSEKEKHPHVISIVGMGGIGKTTLAQLAYNDGEVIKKFDKRIWVCVSDTFDEIKIVKAIIEGLTDDVCNFVELQSHLNYIYKLMTEKKVLLILDDVWTEEYNWEPLYYCFNNSLHGSKILVTTRKETILHMMKSFDIIKLGELIGEESWSLFKQLAFSNRLEYECRKLEKIGKDIVDKCKGLPLAVKIVGSLLRFKKTEEQWQRILDNDLWNLEELNKGIFPPLLLSYNDLPLREKRCFSYCAIFPKDYKIDKNELIQLWMAQGYLGLEQSEELETIGQDCFDNLAIHSLFQKSYDYRGWKMHDIVHDFTQFLVNNECLSMTINTSEAQCLNSSDVKARHLMLILNDKEISLPSNICSAQKLRSLLIVVQDFRDLSMVSELQLSDIFDKLTCLRALKLSREMLSYQADKMIPEKVRKLIHLRYLDMSFLKIKEIPEVLCDLYNLQTLNLYECSSLEKLPQGMGKLINLRHLITAYCYKLRYMPRGVENLRRLRTLSDFVVARDVGSSLGSLQNLNHLRGEVTLKRLGNVGDPAEAKRAQLNKKKNLIDLCLIFDHTREESASASASGIEKDGAVLEELQPPLNLEKLYIKDYRGTLFPEWMTWLTQLKSLTLSDCIKCEQLPALGKLPSLESLRLLRMESLKRVGNELLGIENATTSSSSSSFIAFPKLNNLVVYDMPEWEDWDDEITRQITIMPSLSSLRMEACPILKAFPEYILHATSLQSLCLISLNKCEQLPALGKLPSLESLHLLRMESLKRVGNELLGIENATTSSSSSSFIAFPKLNLLHLMDMPEWEDWDGEITRQITIMPSLSHLYMEDCPKLKALPEYILHATSIKDCSIYDCPKLEKLPPVARRL